MSRGFAKWLGILLGTSMMAGIVSLAILSLRVNEKELAKLEKYHSPQILVKENRRVLPAQEEEMLPKAGAKIGLKDPFVVPAAVRKIKVTPEKSKHPFNFVGIIETDNNLVAMIKVKKTREVLLVHEGEYITHLGLEIRKINLESLTYYRDGKEAVLSLGGDN